MPWAPMHPGYTVDMDHPLPRAVVALVNADDATRQALKTSLAQAGFSTVSPEPRHFQAGALDFERFLSEEEPAVVIYDLAPPYAESWRALQAAGNSESAKERYLILTTRSKAALEQALGRPTEAIEINDQPFAHHELVRTVRRTFEARAQGTEPQ